MLQKWVFNNDTAKKLSVYGFREYFLETLFLKKNKLNICGILDLDSSSGDDKH